jgi:hypothetical protein
MLNKNSKNVSSVGTRRSSLEENDVNKYIYELSDTKKDRVVDLFIENLKSDDKQYNN